MARPRGEKYIEPLVLGPRSCEKENIRTNNYLAWSLDTLNFQQHKFCVPSYPAWGKNATAYKKGAKILNCMCYIISYL